MSEQRDLLVPGLVAVVGLAVAVWNAVTGAWGNAVLALAAAAAGAGIGLAFTLKKRGFRSAAIAGAALLVVAAVVPGSPFEPLRILPWAFAATALAFHAESLSISARRALLLGSGALALVAAAVALRLLPVGRAAAEWALAGALACAVQVWTSRPRPEAPIPVGPLIAVFGGSFDPFHRAHREICEAVLRRADRLLVVVAGKPPHKEDREVTPFHHRVAMARLGTEGLPRTEVVEIEGRREGPTYTVDTLDSIRRLYPAGTRFRLVIGADSFQDFPLWHSWEAILDRADLWVAARPGFDLQAPPEFEGRNAPVEPLETAALPVSSTDLRRRVREGRPLGDDLSPAVQAYVRDHGLYGEEHREETAAPRAEEQVHAPPKDGSTAS